MGTDDLPEVGVGTRRVLRWRMIRGPYWLDVVEERRIGSTLSFIGLVNGREQVRAEDPQTAGCRLIRAFLS